MKNLKTKLIAACFMSIILASCSNDDDGIQIAEVVTDNPLTTEVDNSIHQNFLPYIENTKRIGLSIAVLDGNNTSYYNYGETHKGNNTLPTENSLYEVGSITKTLTAAVVTRLMLDNDIPEDMPISNLLPPEIQELSYEGEVVKLKHLFNHTSGLPSVPGDLLSYGDLSNPYANYDFEKLTYYLNNFQLNRTPGSQYEYSNIGFALLGIIVAYQTDTNIYEFMNSITEGVVGMQNTKMELHGIANSNENVIGAYKSNGNEGYYWTWNLWESAGGLYSNLVDMEKYARVHFDSYSDNLDLKEVIDTNKVETFSDDNVIVGRSWHIKRKDGNEVFWHTGGTGGFTTVVFIEPQQEKAIIVLANNADVDPELLPACASFFGEFLE